MQALNSQARDSYARASQLIGGEPQASLSTPNGATFAQQWFVDLRRQGWPVSPLLQGRLLLKGHEDQRLQLMGIEPVSLPADSAVAGQALPIERVVEFFTPPGSTWISPETLQALDLRELFPGQASAELSEQEQAYCMGAVGAALRQEAG